MVFEDIVLAHDLVYHRNSFPSPRRFFFLSRSLLDTQSFPKSRVPQSSGRCSGTGDGAFSDW